jgi:dihydrofolate synthase/folylpolyglutamate synthase
MSLEHPETDGLTMKQVYHEILSRAPEHKPQPSLVRMRHALDLMGHPEKDFRVVHITGTDGKGSTSMMTEALLRAYGLRTGLYTSPHLERVNERISIDGTPLSDERFIDAFEQVKGFIDLTDEWAQKQGGERMSFFEVLTLMAIWAFADAPVDVAVVEVGMGGLWDATNVIDGDACIINTVGMDHMQWLGNTIEKIATEKAGIIKGNSTVIEGRQSKESVEKIIADKAHSLPGTSLMRDGHELEVVSRTPAVGGQVATLRTPNGTYTDVPIKAFGEFQAHNALLALAACEVVIPVAGALDGKIVEKAFSTLSIPGRMEVIRHSPTILLDGGHNPLALQAVVKAVNESFAFKQCVGVVSMMKDKQVETCLGILEPLMSQIVVTENSEIGRVMPVDDLYKIACSVFGKDRVYKEPLMTDAIQQAVDLVDANDEEGLGYGHGILITGSFVTVGDARRLLEVHNNKNLLKPKNQRVHNK